VVEEGGPKLNPTLLLRGLQRVELCITIPLQRHRASGNFSLLTIGDEIEVGHSERSTIPSQDQGIV
jgi:hypothetical protein